MERLESISPRLEIKRGLPFGFVVHGDIMRLADEMIFTAGRTLMEGLLEPTHLFFILLIVLIIFGPGKLPELGKGLGKGIREFKGAIKGVTEEARDTGHKTS